jgi:hypothetical protein
MLASIVVTLATVTTTPVQVRPDFSGTWMLISQPPADAAVPRRFHVRQSAVSRDSAPNAARSPVALEVVRYFHDGARTTMYQAGTRGGFVSPETQGSTFDVRHSHRSVTWEGDALLIDEGSHTGAVPEKGEWSERVERWVLEENARLRVTVITRGSRSEPRTLVLTYRRE